MSAATTVRNFDDGTMTVTDDGGNSATITNLQGSYSVSDVHPKGRAAATTQVQGAFIGDRLGERTPVKISFEAVSPRLDADFIKIMMGTIAGFTSTVADIGDGIRFDLELDESYSTDSRVSTFKDCRATISYTVGQPGSISGEIECIGPVVLDGVTVIASR